MPRITSGTYYAPLEPRLARRRAYVVAGILSSIAVASVGCADDSMPATPLPPVQAPPPPPPSPSLTISGIVIEYTASDHHPAAGVLLSVLSEEAVTSTSDENGRFSAHVRGGRVAIVPAATAAYLSPCPAGTTWLSVNPNRTFEVNVVSKDVLSTTGMPESYPVTIPVSGTVFERSSDGPHPVAGALVSLGDDSSLGFSTTLSDALGRYTICSAPPNEATDQPVPLRAAKDGYFADSLIVLGGWPESGVNMELVRNP